MVGAEDFRTREGIFQPRNEEKEVGAEDVTNWFWRPGASRQIFNPKYLVCRANYSGLSLHVHPASSQLPFWVPQGLIRYHSFQMSQTVSKKEKYVVVRYLCI